MSNRIGQQLGNYRLIQIIGKGGFADVYLGEHLFLKTFAAIKVLHIQLTSNDWQAFQTEAQTQAKLQHQHIIRVLEFGVDPASQTQYLVMDYASNGTLRRKHPAGAPVPLPLVVSYVKQAADALQFAHDHSVIHRDVKPENMLLGKNDEVLLSDFGIARVVHGTSSFQTHSITGTVSYMAPEQIQGRPGAASDQYALGVTVYEWLCGECPFTGAFYEVMMKKSIEAAPSLRQKAPSLPPVVEQVVMRALERDAQRRYPTIKEFALSLERCAGTFTGVPPTQSFVAPTPPRPSPTPIPPSPPLAPQPSPVTPPGGSGILGSVTALPRPDATYVYWPTFSLPIPDRQRISSGQMMQEPLRTTGSFYQSPVSQITAQATKPPIITRSISNVSIKRSTPVAGYAQGYSGIQQAARPAQSATGPVVLRTTMPGAQSLPQPSGGMQRVGAAQTQMQVARSTSATPPVSSRSPATGAPGSLSYAELASKRSASIWSLTTTLLSILVLFIGFITIGSKQSFLDNGNFTGYQQTLGWESFFVYLLATIGLITGIVAVAKQGIPNDTRTRANWGLALSIIVMVVAIALLASIGGS